jgi:hypothetical protein
MLEELGDVAITFVKESGGFLCLATAIGVYHYRYLNRFFKLILLQATAAILSYFAAYAVVHYQISNGLLPNNHWVYNMYIFLEIALLLWAGLVFFERSLQRRMLLTSMCLFIGIYSLEITIDGFWQLANISLVSGGVMIVIVYQAILFTKMRASNVPLWLLPEFWLCTGVSMYFACNVPFIGLMPQLLEYNPDLVDQLFYITEILAITRYLFLCISLYLLPRMQTVISS